MGMITFRRRKETFSRTMGTMRNNFAAVFVLHILMHLTSQSLSLRGTNENSSKRNNPDLPICDEKLMLKLAEEDWSSDQDNFGKNSGRRSTRNVDVSTTDVIVYTIEGCLPSKIELVRVTDCT
ncbi:hypothetical protein APICC_08603 [Apis cerana cerana]|uniref:Uncharacterized protein n=1 Tax=Apis cerana cerana TaxID=94128 RepID=A0A2A3E5U5_APICC|nr:hypothetical protein APICC_08603 [Apis cerana cerana]